MSTVVFDISMSLHGFITASGRRPEEPLGDGGQRLHEWAFGEHERNCEYFEQSISELGAVIAGRNTYDDSLPWWEADGPGPPTAVRGHARGVRGESRGWRLHLRDRRHRERAQAGASRGRVQGVTVIGGASIGKQYIAAGLVDEISIHLVPVLFHSGTHILRHLEGEHIQLEPVRVIETNSAIHLRFRIVK